MRWIWLSLALAIACGGGGMDATEALTLVPDDARINGDSATEIGTRGLRVAVVRYGEQQDCPSGCFSSVLCAVELEGEAYLLSAAWYSPDEMPPQAAEYCGSDTFSTESCRTPALDVLLPAELEELRDRIDGSGPLRRCSIPSVPE